MAEYVCGLVNGIDHGIRLRAENKVPVLGCMRCGEDHLTGNTEGEGGSGATLPDNLVTSGGDPVVFEGSYVTYG